MSTEAVRMESGGGDGRGADGHMPLMEHLVELRSRLIKCAIAVAVGGVVGWLIYPSVLSTLIHPLEEISKNRSLTGGKLILTDPLEGFLLRVKISAYLGFGLAMPVLLWQVWRFVAPGLYANERRYATGFVVSATLLFASGAAIAYWTLPKALEFLQSIAGPSFLSAYTGSKYLTLIVYMMLAFGAGFEFPILLVFLQLVGVLDSVRLRQFRRYAIVIIFVVAAVITPSADPFSLFALAIPMTIFYEVSILFGRIRERRRRRAEAA